MLIKHPASAVEWARVFIYPILKDSAVVVDATAGNGHDTLFLAENIGSKGHIYAFDIQEEALLKTKARIESAGVGQKVTLFLKGHQCISNMVGQPLDAVMFNLGYLPGSSRIVITKPDSTKLGIISALKHLKIGGRISVVVYTGHPGAKEEAAVVDGLLTKLNINDFNVQKMIFHNSETESPVLYFVTKMSKNKCSESE